MKNIFVLLLIFLSSQSNAQTDTDIYLCAFELHDKVFKIDEPRNITQRKGYDNQPSFSQNGNRIYYSANYTGTNDIYCYDIPSQRTLTITNTPATSEFSPLETPDGKKLTCVFIEKDTVTQRIWEINLKNRKEKLFAPYNDSIGYYWPLENEWGGSTKFTSTGVRKVNYEYDVAVFVLGTNEGNHSLRIIQPKRKNAREKFIDDSVGRCIRIVEGKHMLTYVKKGATGNILHFYDLHARKTVSTYYLGYLPEDYCWLNNTLIYADGSQLYAVRFNTETWEKENVAIAELGDFGIHNIKRIQALGNQLVFVADDAN